MRRRGLGSVLVGFGAVLAFIVGLRTEAGDRFWQWLRSALLQREYYTPHSWLGALAWRTLGEFVNGLRDLFFVGLVVGGLATIGAVVARSVAWARVRDGKADPLERLRSRHRLTRALTAAPAVLLSGFGLLAMVLDTRLALPQLRYGLVQLSALADLFSLGGLVALTYAVTRAGMRALLAPLETEVAAPKDRTEIVFSAVAVTARTRAAVGAFAAASVAMVAWTASAASDPRFLWALAAYVAAATTAPFVFRRASQIAVGVDGVWVRDGSRSLFFAYKDLDEARARGADLDLVRSGRTTLRLQMHGDDASRRDEVLARINDAIARSRESTTRGAEMVVQAMPTHRVASTSMGGDSYRLPSISREQLWELVEGSTADAPTRAAAAEALATALDDTDRARLRVAASQCAEPRLRVALDMMANGQDVELDEANEERSETAGRLAGP